MVDPVGDLYKCWDDIGMKERRVGTIFEPPMLSKNMINWMAYEPDDPECQECFAFPMCMGGCPNHALNGEGNVAFPSGMMPSKNAALPDDEYGKTGCGAK